MHSQQEKPASFISKLYNILRTKQHAKIICWDSDLRGIRVLNQKRMEDIILPKYFRHNRFSSFVRQLNMYDFHKVHLADHKSIFLHKTFDPKKKDDIYLIRRKVTFADSEKQVQSSILQQQEKENKQFCQNLMKSSRRMLYKSSFRNLISSNASNMTEMTNDQVMQELLTELIPLKSIKEQLQQKIEQLKYDKRYRKFLLLKKFRSELFCRLGVELQNCKQQLSMLSIEDELVYKTRKSLGPPKSLKLLESGPLTDKKDTIGNFLSL